eukprot:231730_1
MNDMVKQIARLSAASLSASMDYIEQPKGHRVTLGNDAEDSFSVDEPIAHHETIGNDDMNYHEEEEEENENDEGDGDGDDLMYVTMENTEINNDGEQQWKD